MENRNVALQFYSEKWPLFCKNRTITMSRHIFPVVLLINIGLKAMFSGFIKAKEKLRYQ